MNRKTYVFMEKAWLYVSIAFTLFTIYIVIKEGFAGFKFYALLTGLTWGMYLVRRGMRRRVDKMISESQFPKKNKKNK